MMREIQSVEYILLTLPLYGNDKVILIIRRYQWEVMAGEGVNHV